MQLKSKDKSNTSSQRYQTDESRLSFQTNDKKLGQQERILRGKIDRLKIVFHLFFSLVQSKNSPFFRNRKL